MKKLFAIVLALALVMSMSATAFAAETTVEAYDDPVSFDILASAESNEEHVVLSVDITYGSMVFKYVDTTTAGLWDPESHSYSEATTEAPQWIVEEGGDKITVTNHSNIQVMYQVVLTTDTNVAEAVTVECNATGYNRLDTAVGTDVDAAPSTEHTVTLTTVDGKSFSDVETALQSAGGIGPYGSIVGSITITLCEVL